MSVADRTMALGLRGLRAIGSAEVIDRAGLRPGVERLIQQGSRQGFRTATRAGRTWAKMTDRGSAERQAPTAPTGLFDLTPSEEQAMLREAFGDFGQAVLRPAGRDADTACAAPAEVLAQAAELGPALLGVPLELGGATSERSCVTTALVAEELARGDMGLAVAILAPASVATALALYGDAEQQATYLPAFTGDDVPAAAVAVHEPHALFDPFALRTTAERIGDGFRLTGEKALVPRAADGELFVVAAQLDGAPALFLVEAGARGLFTAPEPSMGVRAAATGRLALEGVEVGAGALLGGADPAVYRELVARGRVAWAALAVGTAQAVLDDVVPYVNERVAFGEPISHRQSVAFMVSNIAIELEGLRLATWRAASRADEGKDFAQQAALARVLTTERGVGIGSDGVQLLGGHGFVKEYHEERWFRDLRVAGMVEGGVIA